MKNKILWMCLTLAAALIFQSCALLPSPGLSSTQVNTPNVATSLPGSSSGVPAVSGTECLSANNSTQSAICSATANPAVTTFPYGSPQPSQVVTAQPDGSLILTLDNRDQTIVLHVGGSFLLKLGDIYMWTVSVEDPTIIGREPNVAVVKGAQGIYLARNVGNTMLSAEGNPACRQSKPACGMPSLMVQFTIEVQP